MPMPLSLPDEIPVFPLPGALLLPRFELPLQIFEPRYLAMVDAALRTDHRLIGIVQPNGRQQGASELFSIGCAGRLTKFKETEDGRYMITLTGVSRFRIRAERPEFAPYRRFEIAWSDFERDQRGPETDPDFERDQFMKVLARFLESRALSTDWDALERAQPEALVNSLSMILDFEPEDKQALLEAPSLQTRREALVALLEYSLRRGDAEGESLQ